MIHWVDSSCQGATRINIQFHFDCVLPISPDYLPYVYVREREEEDIFQILCSKYYILYQGYINIYALSPENVNSVNSIINNYQITF